MTDVVVLLNGDEGLEQCRCGETMCSLHIENYTNGDYWWGRFALECPEGHVTVLVSTPELMDEEMKGLLDGST